MTAYCLSWSPESITQYAVLPKINITDSFTDAPELFVSKQYGKKGLHVYPIQRLGEA